MADGKLDMVEVAKSKRHVALLEKLNSRKPLTAREIEELEEFEQESARRAKLAEKKRPRRVGQQYRAHLEHIARIYVECNERPTEAAARVAAEIPLLKSCKSNYFGRWKGNTEWAVALRDAKASAAFDSEFKPTIRGRKFLQWARETAKRLAGEHETAVSDEKRLDIQCIEGRIVKLNEAIRAEEKHQDELQDKAVRRDMRTFAKNFVELFATYLTDEGQRKLLDVQRDPGALMKGIE
ncbi:MAG TPA: hypothetical protein VM186_00955 [Planctomycetota bacterium]|nr:hypothetical protein [Planctomycetota bacterium]